MAQSLHKLTVPGDAVPSAAADISQQYEENPEVGLSFRDMMPQATPETLGSLYSPYLGLAPPGTLLGSMFPSLESRPVDVRVLRYFEGVHASSMFTGGAQDTQQLTTKLGLPSRGNDVSLDQPPSAKCLKEPPLSRNSDSFAASFSEPGSVPWMTMQGFEAEQEDDYEDEGPGFVSLKAAATRALACQSFTWGSSEGDTSSSQTPAVIRDEDLALCGSRCASREQTPLDLGWMPSTRDPTPIHIGCLTHGQAAHPRLLANLQIPPSRLGGAPGSVPLDPLFPAPSMPFPSRPTLAALREANLQQLLTVPKDRPHLQGVDISIPPMTIPTRDGSKQPPQPSSWERTPCSSNLPTQERKEARSLSEMLNLSWEDDDTCPLPPGLVVGQKLPPGLGSAVVSNGVLSRGSLGHPEHCGLACKYAWRTRGCKDGANCRRCHVCRWRRSTERRGEQGLPRDKAA